MLRRRLCWTRLSWATSVWMLWLLIGGTASSGQSLFDQFDPGAALQTQADPYTISAVILPASDDEPARLQVTAKMDDGWHIYSITQKPGGPVPTKITLDEAAGLKLAGDFVADPAPDSKIEPLFDNIEVETHHGTVRWTAPLEVAAGTDLTGVTLSGNVMVQACSTVCIAPKRVPITAKLAAAASSQHSVNQGQENASAASFAVPGAHARLQVAVTPATAAAGQQVELRVTLEPETSYYVYAYAEQLATSKSRPTLIVLDESKQIQAGPAKADSPAVAKTDPISGQPVELHRTPVTWTVPLTIAADAAAGQLKVSGFVGLMTCSDVHCDLPQAVRFTTSLTVDPAATEATAAAIAPVEYLAAGYAEAATLAGIAEGSPAALATTAGAASGPSLASGPLAGEFEAFDVAQTAQNTMVSVSPLTVIFSALLGGMILNLMPCVFPVIGLKLLSFVEQSHHDRTRLLVLNLWYTLGVVLVFLAIALLAVILRAQYGVDFIYGSQQSIQGYAIGMAAVMFVMGLSLLGVWEIPIPGFIGSGKSGELMAREGAVGAISKGAITTLLGASCGAPVVAVAFTFALDRNTSLWATFGTFALIGLGMASPYLILGANPKLLRFMPKPGPWMESFKHACGFILLGAMVWVLSWLKFPNVVPTMAFLVGLWLACWRVGRISLTAPLGRKLTGWAGALVIALVSGYFAFGPVATQQHARFNMILDPKLSWEPFSQERLAELTRSGKTVMVDFTADWCLNCKWLEANVLNTSEIKEVVSRNGVVSLVADYTDAPAELTQMMTALNSKAVPLLAIFPAGDPNRPIVFRDGYQVASLAEALRQAGPSRTRGDSVATASK